VQQVATSGTTSVANPSTISTSAFSPATTAGNYIIVTVAGDYTSSSKVSSISGGGVSGNLTNVVQKNGASGAGDIEIWYGKVATGATTAIKVTMTSAFTAANMPLVNASEWSGLTSATPTDVSTGGTGTAATFTAGPVTTTVNGDLVISGAWSSVTGYTSAQNSTTAGFIKLNQSIFSSYYRGWAAYQVTGVAGANSAGWNQSGGTSGNYATAIAAFKP